MRGVGRVAVGDDIGEDRRVCGEWSGGAEWRRVPIRRGDGVRYAGKGQIGDGGAGAGVAWDRVEWGGDAGGAS